MIKPTFEQFIVDFAQQFDDLNPDELKPETVFRTLDGWDSMVGLSVMAMADELYNVKLTGDDIRSAQTVGDLFQKLLSKIG